jgi:hypothetical protein
MPRLVAALERSALTAPCMLLCSRTHRMLKRAGAPREEKRRDVEGEPGNVGQGAGLRMRRTRFVSSSVQ